LALLLGFHFGDGADLELSDDLGDAALGFRGQFGRQAFDTDAGALKKQVVAVSLKSRRIR